MRTIYAATTRRPLVTASGPSSEASGADEGQEEVDFLAQPDSSALAEALHKRVKQLLSEVEVQDSSLRTMEVRKRGRTHVWRRPTQVMSRGTEVL
jgi:hypothetical protein